MERESPDEIEAEAVRWIWRRDREGRTPELKAELEAWLAGDDRRQGAFLQAEATWSMLDSARLLAGERPPPTPRLPRRVLLAGGIAALAASVAAFMILAPAGQHYGTSVGEIRSVPLADGSTAAINTQSLVQVELKPDARIVNLAEGEVWFHVAKDPARPFIVQAGRVRVRAVGTAFSVRRRDDGADVLVTEGTVEAWVAGAEGHTVRVAAGSKAFVADNARISEKNAAGAEIDRALAWRTGKIDLAGETLAEAAAEFNRYNTRKLAVTDPKMAEERFFGVFRTDDPDGFARAVRQSLGAKVVEEEKGIIRIGAAE